MSAPIMGRLADKIGTSRPLVLFGICCHLAGAVVYFTAPKLPGGKYFNAAEHESTSVQLIDQKGNIENKNHQMC